MMPSTFSIRGAVVRTLNRLLVVAALLFPIAAQGQENVKRDPNAVKSKHTYVIDADKWASTLTEKQLLSLPKADTKPFSNALEILASYADGPRDHVDEYLKAVGYPVDEQGSAWRNFSPATKIALAAKQAYTKSERDGNLFGALLARRLSMEHPAFKTNSDVAPFLEFEVDAAAKPQFHMKASTATLAQLPESYAKAILHIASYVSSGGAVTDADLARMTPLAAVEQVEILAKSKTSHDALTTLMQRSHEEFQKLYKGVDGELMSQQLLGKWTKAVVDTYPAAGKETALTPWKFKGDSPPGGAAVASTDTPTRPGGGGGAFTPRRNVDPQKTETPGNSTKKPNVGSL